jgi:hypothetical protein
VRLHLDDLVERRDKTDNVDWGVGGTSRLQYLVKAGFTKSVYADEITTIALRLAT